MNELLHQYFIEIEKITKYQNYIIIEDIHKKQYLVKVKDSNKEIILSFFKEIDFSYYVPLLNDYEDSYEIYPYYEDHVGDSSYKAKELIHALIDLQLKSMDYQEYSLEQLKEYYENKVLELDELMNYYSKLNDTILENTLSPSSYLLLIHISDFYQNISISRMEIEKWYSYQDTRIRISYIIGNVSLKYFKVGDYKYFIDLSRVRRDIYLYDMIEFIQNEILNVDMISLFEEYQSKLNLSFSEYSFLFSSILIPNKIELTDYCYFDTIKIRNEINRIQKLRNFYLEENKKYQEANKEEFKEKDKDI